MWWLYIAATIVVLLGGFIFYVFRKGYDKVKPAPLKDIPCPPLTHPLLGHPDKMLHPLKHELRLEVCEAARSAFHQLVMMKHSSVFINDAAEAGRLMEEMPSKGQIYSPFRYDANIPDMLASDGEAWNVRRKALGPALTNIGFSNDDSITSSLLVFLGKASESSAPISVSELATYVAFDCVCEAAFGYQLGAVNGSNEGKLLHESLVTLVDVQASKGIYANTSVRKVTPDELNAAQATWKNFLVKMLSIIRSDSEQYRLKNGALDGDRNFGHALIQLSFSEEAYGDAQLTSEIHQVLRHGYETISGTLQWMFYALAKNPKIRADLERAVLTHKGSKPYPDYLENVVMETMRRYPVVGNMTVRTINTPDFELVGGYPVPQGTPVHMHMWSLHNTSRNWDKPKEFNPNRWVEDDTVKDTSGEKGEKGGHKGIYIHT
jgi:cytochrome P450